MHVKIERIEDGLHPDEKIVRIDTLEGPEELIVNHQSIIGSTLEIGRPIAESKDGQRLMIELPAETASGSWRVWVSRDSLNDGVLEAAE